MRSGSLAGLLWLLILLMYSDLAAQIAIDVNIAMGLDISASTGRHEEMRGWSDSGLPEDLLPNS
jgi:hypothetical protein